MQNVFRVYCFLSSVVICMRGSRFFCSWGRGESKGWFVFQGRFEAYFRKFYFVNLLNLNSPGGPPPFFPKKIRAWVIYHIFRRSFSIDLPGTRVASFLKGRSQFLPKNLDMQKKRRRKFWLFQNLRNPNPGGGLLHLL